MPSRPRTVGDLAGPFHSPVNNRDPLTHSWSASGGRQGHPETRVAEPGSQQVAEEGGQQRHGEQQPLSREARLGLRRRWDPQAPGVGRKPESLLV